MCCDAESSTPFPIPHPCGADQSKRGRNYILVIAAVHQPDFLTSLDGSDIVRGAGQNRLTNLERGDSCV